MKSSRCFQYTTLGVVFTLALILSRTGHCQGLDFGHHDNQKLAEILRNISQTYPTLTRLYSIGRSVRGVELWVLAVGESPRNHVLLRPNVKLVANMHGNEVVGREELLHFAEYLVTNYGRLQNVTHLLNTSTVHLLPSLNPDGYATGTSAPDCIKNFGRYNANRQDLNRNFPDFFRKNLSPIQPETRAIMDWVHKTQFVLSANLHGGSLVANYPFDNYRGNEEDPPARLSLSPDDDVFVHLAKTYALTHPTMAKSSVCPFTNFVSGITNGAKWYPVTGGMQDYNYIFAGCYEITVELSCCKFPPASQLRSFWEADREPLLAYLMQVSMGVRGIVRDNSNNPLRGAVVTVEGRDMVHSETTEFGEYWRLLLPGSYNLLVSIGSCSPTATPFKVKEGIISRLDVTLDTENDCARAEVAEVTSLAIRHTSSQILCYLLAVVAFFSL